MKRFSKSTKKNMGFSLVEVLVAMAVIAIISVPLIRTFVVSANMNKKARRLQNATDIAQNVSEYFKTIELGELRDKFKDDRVISSAVLYDDDKTDMTSTGTMVFQNVGGGDTDSNGVPYYEGADGEDFYVTVVLNPTDYSEGSASDVADINNYISPEIGDLFSVDTVTAFSQFTKYDNKIKTAFKRSFTSTQVPEDLEYSDIKKTVTVNIEQYQNAVNTRKIDYTYSLTVRYTYCNKSGNDYIETDYYLEYHFVLADGTVDGTGLMPALYLLYTPYDVNDPTHTEMFVRDEMIINYRKGEVEESWEKPVDLYIVQQDGPTETKGLDYNKIHLYAYSDAKDLAVLKHEDIEKFDMFANVTNWPDEYKVTAGNTTMVQLYTVDVYVWYREQDTTDIEEYLNPDFAPESHFTIVSTIKEE